MSSCNDRSEYEYTIRHVVLNLAVLNKILGMATGDGIINNGNESMDDETDVMQREGDKKLNRNLFDLDEFNVDTEVTVSSKKYKNIIR